MGLTYITKGNVKITNERKVLYCCHKDEYEKYCEETIGEIHKYVDCAIFYIEHTEEEKGAVWELEEDVWKELLLDINLIVVRVTQKLLNTENQAKDIFLYAIKKGIPVLPILENSHLVNKFNEICGEIQFLLHANEDETQIPYEQKLETYLNMVLADDEIIHRIYAISNGFVFLSYRKKDRKHVLELIRKIRMDEKCIDIAIWYDEFLVIGESFNEQIKKKLKDGKVFLLSVTPNLVNEENYVQQHEYPMALEEKKIILPVEMVKTDRKLLEQQYSQMPECIEESQFEKIIEELKNIFDEYLDEKSENSERKFLVGYGYLSGIGREKNVELAEKRIVEAANLGHVEAIKKLVVMYTMGEGVIHDLKKAIEWQEHLVEILGPIDEGKSIEEKGEIAFEWIRLGDLYAQNLKQIKKAEHIYEEVYKQIENDEKLNAERILVQDKLDSLDRARKIKKISDDFKNDWEKANESGDVDEFIILAQKYDNLRAYKEAKLAYEKAIEMLEKLKQVYTPVMLAAVLETYVEVYYRAANVYTELGEYENAFTYLQKAFEIVDTEKVWKDDREEKLRMDELYRTLSDFYRVSRTDKEGYSSALSAIKKAIDCSKELEMDSTMDYGLTHVDNLRRKGGLLELLGNYDAAVAAYNAAIKKCKNIADRSGDVDAWLVLASLYNDMGDVSNNRMKKEKSAVYWNDALRNYEEAQKIHKKIIGEISKLSPQEIVYVYSEITISNDNLGRMMMNMGERQGYTYARRYFKENVDLCEELYEKNKMNREIMYHLFYSYIRVAEVNILLEGDKKEAKEYYEKARNFAEEVGINRQVEIKYALKRIEKAFHL